MTRLPVVSSRKALKALQQAGFYIHHTKGSHVNLHHPTKTHLKVVVPFHGSKDIKPSTLQSILRQADLTIDEFLELL